MASKKFLKFSIPLVGLTSIAVAMPIALTSCNSSSDVMKFSSNLAPITKVSKNSGVNLQVVAKDKDANYQWLIKSNNNQNWELISGQTTNSLYLSPKQVDSYKDNYSFACLIYNEDKTQKALSEPTVIKVEDATFKLEVESQNAYPNLDGIATLIIKVSDIPTKSTNFVYNWYELINHNGGQSINLYKTTNLPQLKIPTSSLTSDTSYVCEVINVSSQEKQFSTPILVHKQQLQISNFTIDNILDISNKNHQVKLTNLDLPTPELPNAKYNFNLRQYNPATSEFDNIGAITEVSADTKSNEITLNLPSDIKNQEVFEVQVDLVQDNQLFATKISNPFVAIDSPKPDTKYTVPNPSSFETFVNSLSIWNYEQLSQLNWIAKQDSSSNPKEEVVQDNNVGIPTDEFKKELLASMGFSLEQISSLNPTIELILNSEKIVGKPIDFTLVINVENASLLTSLLPENDNLKYTDSTITIQSIKPNGIVYTGLESAVTTNNINSLIENAKNWDSKLLNSTNINLKTGEIIQPTASRTTEPTSLWDTILNTLWYKPSTGTDKSATQNVESMKIKPTNSVEPGQPYELTLEVNLKNGYCFDSKAISTNTNIELNNGRTLRIKKLTTKINYIEQLNITETIIDNLISNINNMDQEEFDKVFGSFKKDGSVNNINLYEPSHIYNQYESFIRFIRKNLELEDPRYFNTMQVTFAKPNQTTRDANYEISELKVSLNPTKYAFLKTFSGDNFTVENSTLTITNIKTNIKISN